MRVIRKRKKRGKHTGLKKTPKVPRGKCAKTPRVFGKREPPPLLGEKPALTFLRKIGNPIKGKTNQGSKKKIKLDGKNNG